MRLVVRGSYSKWVGCNPGENFINSVSWNTTGRIWNADTGEPLHNIQPTARTGGQF
jgi:hypothetical protein